MDEEWAICKFSVSHHRLSGGNKGKKKTKEGRKQTAAWPGDPD